MAQYDLMVIYDPFLEEAEQAAQIEKASEQVKRRGGTVTNVDAWGKRRLAYPINKKQEGYYLLLNFEGDMDGPSLAEVERTLRLDEKVMRVMITRIPAVKPSRRVKVKKPKAERQGATEVQYGQDRRGSAPVAAAAAETISAGQAGMSTGPIPRA